MIIIIHDIFKNVSLTHSCCTYYYLNIDLTQNKGMDPVLDFRSRFLLDMSDEQVRVEVRKMIKNSSNHFGTRRKEIL